MGRDVGSGAEHRVESGAGRGVESDVELAARLVAGDLDALRRAYDEHGSYVYGMALTVAGEEPLAEEITQELFVALWEQPLAYDPRLGSLRGWLAGKALHAAALRVKAG